MTDRPRRIAAGLVGAVVVGVVGLAVLAPTTPAAAVTNPADGSTMPSAPTSVSVTFPGRASITMVHLSVVDAGGRPVTTAQTRLSDRTALLDLSIVDDGGYALGYHALFSDGQQVIGESHFTVGPAGSGPEPAIAAGHDHTGPFNLALLGLDAVLLLALAGLFLLGRTSGGHHANHSGFAAPPGADPVAAGRVVRGPEIPGRALAGDPPP